MRPPFQILYEDNHILALFKPAGVLSQPTDSGEESLLDQAKIWLKERYHKPGNVYLGTVHRLDRPVCGVIIYTKTSKATSRLCKEFREHRIKKEYIAICKGTASPSEGILTHFLTKNHKERKAIIANEKAPDAKIAKLHYKTLDSCRGYSLIGISLLTGRSHQIRSQLAAIHLPILGDRKYHGADHPSGMIALIAKTITFIHPTKQVETTIEAPFPAWWQWPPGSSDHSLRCSNETAE